MKDIPVVVIFLIFGVVLALAVVGVGSGMTNSGKQNAQVVQGKMDSSVQSAIEAEFTDYDGTTQKGATVVNLIKNWSNETICVEVVTNKSTTTYIYTDMNYQTKSTNTIAKALDKSDNAYINQNAEFLCTITRDTNGAVGKVQFKQQ